MITRMMLLVGCVWSLCPFTLLPFPISSSTPSAFCVLRLAQKAGAPWIGPVLALAIGIGHPITLCQPITPEREDSLWRGEIKIQQVRMASPPNYAQVQAQIIATSTEEPGNITSRARSLASVGQNPNELQQGPALVVGC